MSEEGNLLVAGVDQPAGAPVQTATATVTAVSADAGRPPPSSLWRNRDFVRFWGGETLSLYGSQVTVLALPLTAVYVFDAGAAHLGLLRFLQLVPYLAFSLLFGVWVDRVRRRPVMVGANLARMVLLALVPLLALLGQLNPPGLLAIAFFVGIASVLFDVSWMSYIPTVVHDKRSLVEANTKLAVTSSSADVAGPGLAGFLVSVVTAPVAIAFDAVSYLVSIVFLLLIRTPEVRPAVPAGRRCLRQELVDGLRWVLRNQYLRALALIGFLCNFMLMFMSSLFVLYAVRQRGLSASTLGLVLSMGAVGGLLGSVLAGRLLRGEHLGRTYIVAMGAVFLSPALIPLAGGPQALVAATFVASYFLGSIGLSVANVMIVSLRQIVTPAPLMGRMTAAIRTTLFGGGALGGLTSGFVGSVLSLRSALAMGAMASATMIIPVLISPIARLRSMPASPDATDG